MSVPDNATIEDLEDEPEGFWDAVHAEVDEWIAMYKKVSDDERSD
jgi:hypothetical protein